MCIDLKDCDEKKDCTERKCVECDIPVFERNNYFCGKLMVERDFWCDQHYHMGKQRRHNKNAHGWGTLCGLKVVQHKEKECRAKYVLVKPGVALDCCGREIVVKGNGYYVRLPEEEDWEENEEAKTIYIAIRYCECYTEPVPSLFSDCGCEEKCEPNRIKESFEIKIFKHGEITPPKYDDGGPPLELEEDSKCDMIYKEIVENRCPECEEPTNHWVILASLKGYLPGVKVVDAENAGNNDIFIENYTYRRLVPSTDVLYKMIRCLMEGGVGSVGTPGETGDPGEDGVTGTDGAPEAPGLGLNAALPKIVDMSWVHGTKVEYNEFYERLHYDYDLVPDDREVLEKLTTDKPPLLTIYFNKKMVGIDRQTFQVQICFPQMYGRNNEYSFLGVYNIMNARLYGHIISLPGPHTTSHTDESSLWAVTFIPCKQFFDVFVRYNLRSAWEGSNTYGLDLPYVHITLKGDFIHGGQFTEKNVLDANNIGGNVGKNIDRDGDINSAKNPSGNMVQGGYFESWFPLGEPKHQEFGAVESAAVWNHYREVVATEHISGININDATEEELAEINGVDDVIAKEIISHRKKTPFKTVFDLKNVSGIGEIILEKNLGRITVSKKRRK